MRPNSKASALVLFLAGFLAQSALARPLCPTGSGTDSGVTCGVDVAGHWYGSDHLIAARAGGTKRPASSSPEAPDAKRPDFDPNDPEGETSGPITGPAFGSSRPVGETTPVDTPNVPADIKDKGYVVTEGAPDGSDRVFTIGSKVKNDDPDDAAIYVAKMRTNKDEGSITIDDARLAEEKYPDGTLKHPGDPKGKENRARLWELQATVALHRSDMKPEDIKMLRAEQVEETRTVDAVKQARTDLGNEFFELRRDGPGPKDQEVFDNLLANSGFGMNAQAFLANVPTGKQVKQIDVGAGAEEDDFSFTLILE